MRTFGISVLVVLGLIVMALLMVGLDVGGIHYSGFLRRQQANVDRKVYEGSNSYNRGKIEELQKYYVEYANAKDDDGRSAIRSVVRLSFADYDDANIPGELRAFLSQCRTNINGGGK